MAHDQSSKDDSDIPSFYIRFDVSTVGPFARGLDLCLIDCVPEELLIIIVKYLETPDLLALSLTSKLFCRVAQDVLYRRIALPITQTPSVSSHIASLLRTLVSHEHLAKRVEHLTWWPLHERVPYEIGPPAAISAEIQSGLISSGKSTAMVEEASLAGHLLSILPRLHGLRFRAKGRPMPDLTRGDIFQSLGIRPDKVSCIPGLANLHELSLGAGMYLRWPLWTLPKLEDLYLGNEVTLDFPDSALHQPSCNLHGLFLEMTTAGLKPQDNFWRNQWSQLLRQLPNLRRLGIGPNNRSREGTSILKTRDTGQWQLLIDTLISAAPMVDSLGFVPISRRCSWLRFAQPIRSLSLFSNIRVLHIPQAILLGWDFGKDSSITLPLQQLLPSNLEKLFIWSPTFKIIHFLEALLVMPNTVPSLCYLGLIGAECHGVKPSDMWLLDGHSIMKRLRDAGISLGYHFAFSGRRASYSDAESLWPVRPFGKRRHSASW